MSEQIALITPDDLDLIQFIDLPLDLIGFYDMANDMRHCFTHDLVNFNDDDWLNRVGPYICDGSLGTANNYSVKNESVIGVLNGFDKTKNYSDDHLG